MLPYTGKGIPLGIKTMSNCNPTWKDLKIGEVMRLLEQSGVHHENPNDLKHRIQGFLKRLKQTVARSDEVIDEGVSSKSWDRVMQVCVDFSKEQMHLQLSNEVRRRECSPLDCSCVAVQCDHHTYWTLAAPACHSFSTTRGMSSQFFLWTQPTQIVSSSVLSSLECRQTEHKVSTCTVLTLADHTDNIKESDPV